MSSELLQRHLPVAEKLLKRHGLEPPCSTVEMLANEIMRCNVSTARQKKNKNNPSAKQRLTKALGDTKKLILYATRLPSRESSVSNRYASLLRHLDDAETRIWIAIAGAPRDLPDLLSKLHSEELNPGELNVLSHALELATKKSAEMARRPRSENTAVVRAGYIAWRLARRTDSFTWDESNDALKGPLPDFILDLIECCRSSVRGRKGERLALNSKNLQKKLVDLAHDERLHTWLENFKNDRIK